MAAPFEPLIAQAYRQLGEGRAGEAGDVLRRVIAQWPDHAGARLLLGIACERQFLLREAAAEYAQALRLMPGLLEAAQRLAGLFEEMDQREAAARLLLDAADAADAAGEGARAHLVRAIGFGMTGQHRDAERALRAALVADACDAEAWRLLGNVLAIDGRMDEAERALRRAFALQPDSSAILGDLARHVVFGEADRPVMQRIERLLAGEGLAPRQRMRLGFALGKWLDEAGDYAGAMRAFDAANALRGRLRPFDRAAWRCEVETRGALPSGGERAVFIVGMPRSGTTLVEQVLSSHRDVAAGGERMFWATQWPASLADLARAHEADLRAISADAVRVTDKNPLNFLRLGLIRAVLPDAFIVHCRRHPVDTCLSCYMTPFESGNAFASSRSDLVWVYREYAGVMAHWRSVLPPRRFLEIDYEALVREAEATTRRLVAFCELAWDDACLAPERNVRPVHTASVVQARRKMHTRSVERWRTYEPWLGELGELL